ncbi:MAG: rhodanese-like domain-containing protein [Bacteroidota bacterium]
MKKFSLNQKLAAVAFILAFMGLLLSFMSPDGIDNANLAPNYISVIDLADKIKNRKPFRVIDLRSEELYEQFHVPTAEHIPLSQGMVELEPSEGSLVFYSGDDHLSRQLWRELPEHIKRRSSILYGGVHDWYERLLYPELPAKADYNDSAIFNKIHELSLFYGGQPDFVGNKEVMKYYQQDFSQLPWSKSYRQNGLVRKGC